MAKYEEMALKLRDYQLKKYEQWKAETERRLPLLMKKPLLAIASCESHSQLDLVCITLFKCVLVFNAYMLLSFLTLLKPLPL